MKFKVLWIAGLMLAATAGQAQAAMVFSNGSISGAQGVGWPISDASAWGYSVSNSFSLSNSTNLTGATAGLWVNQGATPTSLYWFIGTSQFGSDVAWGTSVLNNTYFGSSDSYDVYESAFSLNAAVSAGNYWLTLQHATATLNSFVYWDVNNGSSSAFNRFLPFGTPFVAPSNSFALFDDTTSAVPEPASIAMWGIGAIGMMFAGRKRRQMKLAV